MRVTAEVRERLKELGLSVSGDEERGYRVYAPHATYAGLVVRLLPNDRVHSLQGAPWSDVENFVLAVTAEDINAMLVLRPEDKHEIIDRVLARSGLAVTPKTTKQPKTAKKRPTTPKAPKRAAVSDAKPRKSSPRVIRTPERTVRCEVCHEAFTPTRSDSRYDTNACRQRAYRIRNGGAS